MNSRQRKLSNQYVAARPSFVTGVARVVDPVGTLNEYNPQPLGKKVDGRALSADWINVGKELGVVVREYGRTVKASQ